MSNSLVGHIFLASRWDVGLTTSNMVGRKQCVSSRHDLTSWSFCLDLPNLPSICFEIGFEAEDSGSHWLLELWKHDSKVDDWLDHLVLTDTDLLCKPRPVCGLVCVFIDSKGSVKSLLRIIHGLCWRFFVRSDQSMLEFVFVLVKNNTNFLSDSDLVFQLFVIYLGLEIAILPFRMQIKQLVSLAKFRHIPQVWQPYHNLFSYCQANS